VRKTKKQVRTEVLRRLNSQARRKADKKSETIKKKLFSLPEFKKSKIVMLFASKNTEVNTYKMIDGALEMGKGVVLPRCTSRGTLVPRQIRNRHKDLEKGAYGVYEPRRHKHPVRPDKIGLIVVPGVAFDTKKTRIGRGKGYYDRFLKKLPPGTITIGLAFKFQILVNLPKDSHDISVSKVITD